MSETADVPDGAQAPETPQAQPALPAAKRGRRPWLRIPLTILFQILLFLLVLTRWVLGTQSGLRFSLSLADVIVKTKHPNLWLHPSGPNMAL